MAAGGPAATGAKMAAGVKVGSAFLAEDFSAFIGLIVLIVLSLPPWPSVKQPKASGVSK